jgi:hypothetical protein
MILIVIFRYYRSHEKSRQLKLDRRHTWTEIGNPKFNYYGTNGQLSEDYLKGRDDSKERKYFT